MALKCSNLKWSSKRKNNKTKIIQSYWRNGNDDDFLVKIINIIETTKLNSNVIDRTRKRLGLQLLFYTNRRKCSIFFYCLKYSRRLYKYIPCVVSITMWIVKNKKIILILFKIKQNSLKKMTNHYKVTCKGRKQSQDYVTRIFLQ